MLQLHQKTVMDNRTAAINRTIDIVGLVGDLRKSGRFYIGPCPFCGGQDRFNVKLADNGQLWLCRVCGDGKYHDAIAFLMQRDNLTFAQVLAAYGGGVQPSPSPSPTTSGQRPRPGMDCAPSAEWQRAALAAAEEAAAFLRGDTPQAVKVRRYLTQERGLQAAMIEDALLGYNPVWRDVGAGCWLAPGVTIPGRVGGQLWYVQVRVTKAARDKAAGQGRPLDKYQALTGSRLKALFGADTLLEAETAIVTEGEFDALLLAQYLPLGWAAVTMGAAGTLPDNPAWLRYFAAVKRVCLVMDNDPAGAAAVEKWRQLLPWVDLLPVPAGHKDITDFWRAGGDLAAWVMGEPLPELPQVPQVEAAVMLLRERLHTITLALSPEIGRTYSWGATVYRLANLIDAPAGWVGTFEEVPAGHVFMVNIEPCQAPAPAVDQAQTAEAAAWAGL